MWSYWAVDTRTGEKLLPLFPVSATWARMLNDGGKGRTVFQLGVPTLPVDYKSLTRPWAHSIVYFWDDTPIYWGVITSRKYMRGSQQLIVQHADIRALLSRRYPFGVTSYWADEPNHLPGSITMTSKSLRAIAAKVVEQGLLGPSSIYSLPIVLPSTSEAGAHSRTYYNYHFQKVTDLLDDLQNTDGGPDIDFEPEVGGAGVRLQMRVGSDATPSLSGNVFDFVMPVPFPRLTDVTFTEDGAKQLTGQFGVGEGSERDMRVGGDGIDDAATIPAIDAVEYYKTESSEPLLAAYGIAAVFAHEHPTQQWEMRMLATEEPGLAAMRLGSIIRMHWQGDPWIEDGPHEVRVISMSGDENLPVVLDVQVWEG